uniref:Uncharacterized protein n=1 Tax=Haemonchus contortus TaxID=6289 RepID=A0A7I4YRZ2_HAECO
MFDEKITTAEYGQAGRATPIEYAAFLPTRLRLSHILMVIFILSASVLAFAEYHRRAADSTVFESSTLSKERIASVGKRNVEQETTTQKSLILDDLETIKLNNADPLPPRMFESLTADQLCQSASTGCLSPFIRMTTLLSTAPNYRLATCLVHKNMSTLMLNIICYLLRGQKFIEMGRSLLKDSWDTSFCGYEKCFDGVDPMLKSLQIGNLSEWSLTMVTREPIDRFLSGFIDRCLRVGHKCYGCGSNMTCFLEQTYYRARLYALTAENNETILPDTTRVDRHVFPQNWRCNLGKYYDNYKFIEYSSNPDTKLLQDLIRVLAEQKVPQSSIDYITNVLQSGRTEHTTFTSKARAFLEHRLRSSPYLMELLVRTFYYDFKLFGYLLPDLVSMGPNHFQGGNSTPQ